MGEDLSCYLHNIRPVGLWKCLYDHYSLPTKRISAISQRKTFPTVLPTRWRRQPAGTEITPSSDKVLIKQVSKEPVRLLSWDYYCEQTQLTGVTQKNTLAWLKNINTNVWSYQCACYQSTVTTTRHQLVTSCSAEHFLKSPYVHLYKDIIMFATKRQNCKASKCANRTFVQCSVLSFQKSPPRYFALQLFWS